MRRTVFTVLFLLCFAGFALGQAQEHHDITFDFSGPYVWDVDNEGTPVMVFTGDDGVTIWVDRGGGFPPQTLGVEDAGDPAFGPALSPFPDTTDGRIRVRIASLGNYEGDGGPADLGWGVSRVQFDMGDIVPSDTDGWEATVTAERTVGQEYSRDFGGLLTTEDQDQMQPGFFYATKFVQMIYPIREITLQGGSPEGQQNSVFYDNFVLTVSSRDPNIFFDYSYSQSDLPGFYENDFLPDVQYGKVAAGDAPSTDFGGGGGGDPLAGSGDGGPSVSDFDQIIAFDFESGVTWELDPVHGGPVVVLTGDQGVTIRIDRNGAPFTMEDITLEAPDFGNALSPFIDTSDVPWRIQIVSLGDLELDPGPYGLGWGVSQVQWDMGDMVPSDTDGWTAVCTAQRTFGETYDRTFSGLVTTQDQSLMEPGFFSATKFAQMIYPITEMTIICGSPEDQQNSAYLDNLSLRVSPRDPNLFFDFSYSQSDLPGFYANDFLPDVQYGKVAAGDAPSTDFGGGGGGEALAYGGDGGPPVSDFDEHITFDFEEGTPIEIDPVTGQPFVRLVGIHGVTIVIDRPGAPFEIFDVGPEAPDFANALSPFADPSDAPFRIRIESLGDLELDSGPYGKGWGVSQVAFDIGDYTPSDNDAWEAQIWARRSTGQDYDRAFSGMVTTLDQNVLPAGFYSATKFVQMIYPIYEVWLQGGGPGQENSTFIDNIVLTVSPRDPNLFFDFSYSASDLPGFYTNDFLPDVAYGKVAAGDAPATDFGGGGGGEADADVSDGGPSDASADAGGPYIFEAEDPLGTPVMLDGSNSMSGSGELTLLWEAVGVTFDDPTSETPTGLFPLGDTSVTLTVTAGGATDTATVTVSVVDTTPPVIATLPDITVECTGPDGEVVDIPTPTVSDNADPNPSLTSEPPDRYYIGITLVTWTATDASGNTATGVQRVVVVDTSAPMLVPPPDVTVSSRTGEPQAIDIGEPTVHDDGCSSLTVTNDAPEIFDLGLTVVTWTATDGVGNSISATQQVTLELMSAYDRMSLALETLIEIGETGQRRIDRKLQKAIEEINRSLHEDLWADDAHLAERARAVFLREIHTIQQLKVILRIAQPGSDLYASVLEAVTLLLEGDNMLAETAIVDARAKGATGWRICMAEFLLLAARCDWQHGRYTAAARKFWMAWELAAKAAARIPASAPPPDPDPGEEEVGEDGPETPVAGPPDAQAEVPPPPPSDAPPVEVPPAAPAADGSGSGTGAAATEDTGGSNGSASDPSSSDTGSTVTPPAGDGPSETVDGEVGEQAGETNGGQEPQGAGNDGPEEQITGELSE